MSDQSAGSGQKGRSGNVHWVAAVSVCTFFASALITLLSEEIFSSAGIVCSFLTLLLIVVIGIGFDVLGVAVTSAKEQPFHAMAARKVPGGKEAVWLLRNAGRVGSVCNDVVGDICGVVSGSAAAALAVHASSGALAGQEKILTLAMSAAIAALTVGGKAAGKLIAMRSCTQIVYWAGKVIHFLPGLGK